MTDPIRYRREVRQLTMKNILLATLTILVLFLVSTVVFQDYVLAAIFLSFPLFVALRMNVSPRRLLDLHQAMPLSQAQAPELYDATNTLSKKASIVRPHLYFIPSSVPNAFTVGEERQTSVALSGGLLNTLNERELKGVLAHELSHIKANDSVWLKLANSAFAVSGFLGLFTHLLLLFCLPMILLGYLRISLFGLLLVSVAPTIIRFLTLAFLRNKEYVADLNAVQLTNDPEGLASALEKINISREGIINFFSPYQTVKSQNNWLDTHPDTSSRVRKVLSVAKNS